MEKKNEEKWEQKGKIESEAVVRKKNKGKTRNVMD